MENPVVSVIIPVFNGEQYVMRAAMSVLRQPCGSDIELIIVDDGSTDKTGMICDSLTELHHNVWVIHKPNSGVSVARNAGIDAANGLYLAFLDADDWWSENVFDEGLRTLIINEPTDLVAFGFRKISPDLRFQKDLLRKSAVFTEKTKPEQFPHCTYFFRSRLLKALGIRYPISTRGEDLRFINLCTFFSKSIRCVDRVLYNYWMNQSSVMHTDRVESYLPELQKAFVQERFIFSGLGIEHDNDREILSMIVSLLPRLCVENSYKAVKRITGESEYSLLRQVETQPWIRLQPDFRLWHSCPALFYIKSQIHPGIMLRVKRLFQKTSLTRRLSDWVQYRLIEKWDKV